MHQAALAAYLRLRYNGVMNGSRYLLYPFLAVALLVLPGLSPAYPYAQFFNIGDLIFFDFNSATLRPDAIATIDKQAKWLISEPAVKVMIEGHTETSGPEDNKFDLGCRRATAVRDALIKRGVAAERLGTVSYGGERPDVLGDNESAQAQNRRAALVLVKELLQPKYGASC